MATLKEGVEIRPNGPSTLLKGEIGDDVAQYLLDSEKAKKSDFLKLPSKSKPEESKDSEKEENNQEKK